MSETHTAIAPAPAPPAPTLLLPAQVAEALIAASRVIENIEAPLDVLNLLIERRKALRKELASIDTQIHILGGAIPKGQRMVWECKRCAYRWQSFSVEPPRACARCRSIGWNKDPVRFTARRPTDPPAPSWKAPSEKDYRRKAARIVPWASPPALTEAVAAAKVDPPTALSVPPPAPSVGLPPPPRASAFAPVTNAPAAPAAPARPLSEQLAEAIATPSTEAQKLKVDLSATGQEPMDNVEADAYAGRDENAEHAGDPDPESEPGDEHPDDESAADDDDGPHD